VNITSLEHVRAVLDIVDDFDQRRVYADGDIQTASAALSDFNAILAIDADNVQAFKGRGAAARLLGQWQSATDDVSRALAAGVDVVESAPAFRCCATSTRSRSRTYRRSHRTGTMPPT
jgi:hypothetical protein